MKSIAAFTLILAPTRAFAPHLPPGNPGPVAYLTLHSTKGESNEAGVGSRFNGGKMGHLYKFDDSYKYTSAGKFHSDEAEKALLHGKLYHKIDGACGMIQVDVARDGNGEEIATGTIRVFERLDTRGKGDQWEGKLLTTLPLGENPANFNKHTYFFKEVTENVRGQSTVKRNRAMLALVDRHKEKLLSKGREWISVEWVGAKFQRTPGVPHDVAMAIHEDQAIGEKDTIERTFDGIKKYLIEDCANEPIEGLIVAHENRYWKVVTNALASASPFVANRSNARPPNFLS